MKVSIRKKMFLISMATTITSFVLIIICFNLICNSYIEKESVMELQAAVKSIESINIKSSTEILATAVTPSMEAPNLTEAAIINSPEEMVDTLQQEFINDGNSISVMITNNITPTETVHYDQDKAQKLKSYIGSKTVNVPQKVSLDDGNYYIITTPVNTEATALLYKNVQPLEDLVANVNMALLVLLLICGIITVATSMGMSNGMVKSIRQLCGYAEDIGRGDFRQRDFKLKELELSILANDMNIMAKQLSDSDKEQKTFFQNVSHELRTPLMSIQGYAEGITAGIFEDEKSVEAADVILTESDRLTTMVEDILYLSRMDIVLGGDKVETIDCKKILSGLLDQGHALYPEKNITLETINSSLIDDSNEEDEFVAEGNSKEFEKAILNILTNGLRYAKESVNIICDVKNRKIIIEDDGPGINEEDIPFIFKRFYKGEGGCTGIGLAISHGVIDKMGGTITGENKEGEGNGRMGARFIISLR